MTACRPGRPNREESRKRTFPISLSRTQSQQLAVVASGMGMSARQLAGLWVSSLISGFYRRAITESKAKALNQKGNSTLPQRASLQSDNQPETEV